MNFNMYNCTSYPLTHTLRITHYCVVEMLHTSLTCGYYQRNSFQHFLKKMKRTLQNFMTLRNVYSLPIVDNRSYTGCTDIATTIIRFQGVKTEKQQKQLFTFDECLSTLWKDTHPLMKAFHVHTLHKLWCKSHSYKLQFDTDSSYSYKRSIMYSLKHCSAQVSVNESSFISIKVSPEV